MPESFLLIEKREAVKEMEDLHNQAFNSEDCREGQKAFQEKRKPIFTGR